MKVPRKSLLFTSVCLLGLLSAFPQQKKSLEVTDLMKFRQINRPSISEDGKWVLFASVPDRGDPEVQIHDSDGKQHYQIPLSRDPVISRDGRWVAAARTIPAEVLHHPDSAGRKDEYREGMILLETATGVQDTFFRVKSFRFTNDSHWILIHHHPDTALADSISKKGGSPLRILGTSSHEELILPFVTSFSVDSTSRFLAAAISDTAHPDNNVVIRDLTGPAEEELLIYSDSGTWADYLAWNNRTGSLAFLAGTYAEKERRTDASLLLWEPGMNQAKRAINGEDRGADWRLHPTNHLRWSKDGKRLFLGTRPEEEKRSEEEKHDSVFHMYDTGTILAGREVDVWHWNDPYINPNQKIRWNREKERSFQAVYFPEVSRLVRLATEEIPDVTVSESNSFLLASTNLPHAKKVTWEGTFRDYHLVDIATGERQLVVENQEHTVTLSPDGKYLAYFERGQWYLVETASRKVRNLTSEMGIPFSDEDWDYPGAAPDYRTAGWVDGSGAILIYDKYDIWQFPTSGSEPICLTGGSGRQDKYIFRVIRLDRDQLYFKSGEEVWLSAYHDREKHTAVFSMTVGKQGIYSLAEGPAKYTLLAKAKKADQLLYTRQSYTEFPDLWVADMQFRKSRKLTSVNPQTEEFAWGEAELVEWSSIDGIPLQGILIKPGNYVPGKRYPVLVYYYRIFSNRLFDFNEVVVNHRPCFPYYASNGYAIFLPDIRFDVGNPGYSATKCLVPGVQKIIDMGIADPNAIALHGHSWSGYQTAFVVTQTNLFACAIAGAPVSNMTSAYSGIRWESGLARQFQYEKSQSRIGGSLWEDRDKYIENSPVFFADRIETPLLIQFGDKDGAVPWYQGIELYLAMRRLGKDCVFLQYRDEPHHLKKYPNKLDYTLKFKAYLDHYLKGEPAEEWITDGVPYRED